MIKKCLASRGFSLLEALMAVSLLTLVLGVMFYIFSVAATSWIKARKLIEVNESAQVTFTRIETAIRSSSVNSVSVTTYPLASSNNAISFLSAIEESTGKTEYTPTKGEMFWKKYIIFYLEDDTAVSNQNYYKLMSKEISLGCFISQTSPYPSQPIEKLPYPPDPNSSSKSSYSLLNYLPPVTVSGSTYISSTRTVSRNITLLAFTFDLDNLTVKINIKTGKPVNSNDANSPARAEKQDIEGLIVLRNR